AANAYERACDAAVWRACSELANLFYDGEGGLVRDHARSADLNARACHGGDPVGCARLGILALLGEGMDRDITRAVSLHREVCSAPIEENRERGARFSRLLEEGRGHSSASRAEGRARGAPPMP
ncbi:MAG: sel1 repeat family protein, partial [Deltaproteobacteria bacterium]|nr:sel1 repeat family protein [Deltaproteobacteria bacterium]